MTDQQEADSESLVAFAGFALNGKWCGIDLEIGEFSAYLEEVSYEPSQNVLAAVVPK